MTAHLRGVIATALTSAAFHTSTIEDPWDAAGAVLAIPEIARALAIAAAVDTEPIWVNRRPELRDESTVIEAHNDLLRHLQIKIVGGEPVLSPPATFAAEGSGEDGPSAAPVAVGDPDLRGAGGVSVAPPAPPAAFNEPDFQAIGDEIGYLPSAVAFVYGHNGGDMPAAIAYLMSIDDDDEGDQ